MPAKSKAQYNFMQGIAHGMKSKGGPTRAQAKEYVAGQSPKGLPAKMGSGKPAKPSPTKAPKPGIQMWRHGKASKRGTKPGLGD